MRLRSVFNRLVLLAATGACMPGLGGCSKSQKLETGYEVRPLNATPTEIRGFYAGRFTQEARAAAMEREDEMAKRRPTPGD